MSTGSRSFVVRAGRSGDRMRLMALSTSLRRVVRILKAYLLASAAEASIKDSLTLVMGAAITRTLTIAYTLWVLTAAPSFIRTARTSIGGERRRVVFEPIGRPI